MARRDPAIPSFSLMLRDAGYHIGQTYKVWSYIRNFKPDRWPEGDPLRLAADEQTPSEQELTDDTFVTLADVDAGPTKAWMVLNREDETRHFRVASVAIGRTRRSIGITVR